MLLTVSMALRWLSSVNPIPEPNVAALLGSLGMLALLRRRRN